MGNFFFFSAVPKHSRAVNSLAWSTQEPKLLSAGLDKVRTDHSVVVWDVTRTSQPPSYTFDQRNSSAGLGQITLNFHIYYL